MARPDEDTLGAVDGRVGRGQGSHRGGAEHWGSSPPHLHPRTDGARRARCGEAPSEERSAPSRSGPDPPPPAAACCPPRAACARAGGLQAWLSGGKARPGRPPTLPEPAAPSTWSARACGPPAPCPGQGRWFGHFPCEPQDQRLSPCLRAWCPGPHCHQPALLRPPLQTALTFRGPGGKDVSV